MENKIRHTIEQYHMLEKGDTVVVGLSGGADSCALLHYLVSIREQMSLRIIACHINHMIRGEEADRDQHFAEQFCGQLHTEFRLLRINVPEEAARRQEGLEQCARSIRYAFFEEIAGAYNGRIATAHTASDNAETVLYHLARGSGIRGLCGIPPVRDRIIRPLITCTREEVEQYCARNEILFVTDSTNLADDYTRNKIRHHVIPVLEEINPAAVTNISRTTEILRCNAEYLYRCSADLLEEARVEKHRGTYKANTLYNAHPAVFAQMMAELCRPYGMIPDAEHIALMHQITHSGGAVQLNENLFAVCSQGLFRIYDKHTHSGGEGTYSEIAVGMAENIVINDKKISLKRVSISEFNNAKKNPDFLFINSGDCDTIPVRAVFRYRQSGDRFAPPHRHLTKSVRKLFIEMKIPAERRNRILLLADGNDIIWIEGIGFSEKYGVTSRTERVLLLTVAEGADEGKDV